MNLIQDSSHALYNVWNELQKPNVTVTNCQRLQSQMAGNYGICMLNIRNSSNIGMTIRTACLLGFKEFIICGRKQYDKRFTVGAQHYIPVVYWKEPLHVSIYCVPKSKLQHHNPNPNQDQPKHHQEYEDILEYNSQDFITKCKESSPWTPVFIEQGGQDIREVCWKQISNPLLILGNESNGIPRNFIKDVKQGIPTTIVVSIPQWSIMRSMNVSVAACIAMWEVSKKYKRPHI